MGLEEANGTPQSSQSTTGSSVTSPPSSIGNDDHASAVEPLSGRQDTPSSQESGATSHSTHNSTSTDEPGIINPELHPSRLHVTVLESDDTSSTPPLSPDNDTSMMADTTIGTINMDEDVFFNGHPVVENDVDFSLAKTDSEAEEDSDDEDVPMVPRLLTWSIPTPMKNNVSAVAPVQLQVQDRELTYSRSSTCPRPMSPKMVKVENINRTTHSDLNYQKHPSDPPNPNNLAGEVLPNLYHYKVLSNYQATDATKIPNPDNDHSFLTR